MSASGNAEQATFWSDQAGPAWVAHQAALDHLMQPVLDRVLQLADLREGQRVLDVGCGTGASVEQAARAVGPGGFVLGADISTSMLSLARTRAKGLTQVDFLLADVAEHAFETGVFDQMISRFGVMFFADSVAAFDNIAKALKPGAQFSFATWGQIPANPFFTLPAQAAKRILGTPPAVDPDAPGPFAFRDVGLVEDILARAGLVQIRSAVDTLDLTPPGGLAEAADLCTLIGPVSRTLAHFGCGEADRLTIRAELEKEFRQFGTPDGVRLPAQINVFQARVPAT